MATGPITQVSDVVVPEIFSGYVQQMTEDKSRLVQSGALQTNAMLSEMLSGGGLTFQVPSFQDLDTADGDNVSTDSVADSVAWTQLSGSAVGSNYPTLNDSVPKKVETGTEVAVRMNRNQSWSSADLAAQLAGADPLNSILTRVSDFWVRRLQAAFVATWSGVIKDNAANDSGDYTNDISNSGTFVDGVTNFSAEAFIDAVTTMGDSANRLSIVMVHSIVYARMQKNNLIDFIPDARGEVSIPTFLGHEVIVDDNLPNASDVYDTWIFGLGASQFAQGSPKVPTEVERRAAAGNGGGQETLFSRQEWCIHPVGHAYTGTSPSGGPGNGTGSNALNNAGSWDRIYPERKQIKFARLLTTEA